jgi:hypothetical protein
MKIKVQFSLETIYIFYLCDYIIELHIFDLYGYSQDLHDYITIVKGACMIIVKLDTNIIFII